MGGLAKTLREEKQALLGFALAPLIPTGIIAASSGGLFWLVLIIAVPAAYLGALLIGVPIYIALRKLQWMSWYFFVVGGALAALPFLIIYLTPVTAAAEINGARKSVFFFGIGAAGGVAFWFISIRNRFRHVTSVPNQRRGLATVSLLAVASIYVMVVGATESTVGRLLPQNAEFVSDFRRSVRMQIGDDNEVLVYLPSGKRFRPNCEVYVVVRRSYLNLKKLYWMNAYKGLSNDSTCPPPEDFESD
jgi:hypothetical protein